MSTPDAPIPRTPSGLCRRGKTLWKSVVVAFALAESETALLLEACRALDDVEALCQAVAAAPMTTIGSRGQEVINPLRAELRSERLLLAKLLSQLDVPMPSDGPGEWDGLSASARARKAVRVRWDHRGGSR
jgi:hypothetical protein